MSLRDLPRIVRLDLSVVELPEWHPEAQNQTSVPVYGYVIDHPDGAILFDTGVGFGNEFIDEVYAPRSERLESALEQHGLAVGSIVAVANSHLHFDHCGQNPAFYGTNVPIYSQAAEITTVEADPIYTDATWALAPEAQRRVVHGDTAIADGVTLLATPGHTPGHQSVLIESDEGRVVLGGQLVWALDEYTAPRASPTNVFGTDWADQALDSINRVRGLEAERVYFGHCPHHDHV